MNLAVKFFAAIICLCCHLTRARWRRFQEGDLLIGALFPVTSGSDCSVVQSEGLALVEAFVFAVDKINANKSRSFLSDVSLGYDIRDSCSSTTVAVNEVLNILGLEQGVEPKICFLSGSAKKTKNCGVIAVVGPDSSHGVMATNAVLSAFEVPQISYGAGSLLLSDKLIYRSLFQTCPSDAQLVASLASIIAYFGWSCINVVSSREDSDATAVVQHLEQTLKIHSVCAVLEEAVNLEDIPRIVSKIRSQDRVSVTVLLGKGSFVFRVLREARKQNLTKAWIAAPKQWNQVQLVENYDYLIDGMLWLSEPKVDLGEFKVRINLLERNSSDMFCAWLEKHNRWNTLCGQNDGKSLGAFNFKGCSLVKVPYVINAVFAVAHGLHQLADQAHTANCPVGNLTLHQFRERLISALTSTSFNSFSNGSVTFKSNGEVNAKYDIMNSYKIDNKNWASVCIGQWTDKKGLSLKNKRIRWPGNEPHVPYSGCSDRCPLGTITKYGLVTCLWECQKCPYGTYNDNFTATHCKTCLRELMPNAERSMCIEKPPDLVDPYGWLAIIVLSVCGLGETLTLFVLGVFVRYQNTPVVRATNLTFTMMTLILLLAWFLLPVLYIGKPTDLTCKLRTVSFCVLYTTVTSVLLAKTNRLIRIFSAFNKTCFLSNCWYGFLTCALILVQFVMSAVYLVLFPPKVAYDFSLPEAVIVRCNEHIVLDSATLAYNVLLSIMCGYLAFKSRKLPRAYNKGKWICLATFTNFVSWVTILIGRHVSPLGKVSAVLTILALTAGAYLMLALLFLPKLRVIFFRPEKNTKQAAIESTRRYSLEQASGIDLSPVQGGRLGHGGGARRHTSPACLTLQLVNGSSVKSAACKSSFGQRRSHVSLIGTIKELPEERKDDCKL